MKFGQHPVNEKIRAKGVYNPGAFSANRKLGGKLKLGFKKPSIKLNTNLGKGIGKIKL